MKKIALTIAILLSLFAVSSAGDFRIPTRDGNDIFIVQYLTLTADASGVDLDADLSGGYLYQVELYASADDAFTFSINSKLGTQLFTRTTTGATSGEVAGPSQFWSVPRGRTMNYTLSGLGSGNVVVEVTLVKK